MHVLGFMSDVLEFQMHVLGFMSDVLEFLMHVLGFMSDVWSFRCDINTSTFASECCCLVWCILFEILHKLMKQ